MALQKTRQVQRPVNKQEDATSLKIGDDPHGVQLHLCEPYFSQAWQEVRMFRATLQFAQLPFVTTVVELNNAPSLFTFFQGLFHALFDASPKLHLWDSVKGQLSLCCAPTREGVALVVTLRAGEQSPGSESKIELTNLQLSALLPRLAAFLQISYISPRQETDFAWESSELPEAELPEAESDDRQEPDGPGEGEEEAPDGAPGLVPSGDTSSSQTSPGDADDPWDALPSKEPCAANPVGWGEWDD